ncbi:hypothetical protein DH2020_031450 [Rehmannia glutinosa]|uniref:DUF674 family protein n=1 Tax=Rehmannia glutinosa TaxID=99300 RepID=A0ABR0VHU9_REHGL
MSSANKDVKFCLKVVINKQKTKVLFAEADSDFADVLLSFLTLPLGKIVRILEKHYGDKAPVFGSLTTLYNGLANLESAHFWTEGCKQMLLNPISSFDECRKLKLDICDTKPVKYFTCEDWDCRSSRKTNVSLYYDIARCDCGKSLKEEVPMKNRALFEADDGDVGVFTKRISTFIISDDLMIFPNEAGSVVHILSNLGITETGLGELMNVTFGFNEIMDLLKGSLISRTPLTDIILNKGQIELAEPSKPGIFLHQIKKETDSTSGKMILKVIVQKSTNKILFAEAEEDFISFLFSLLTVPLGGVERLLEGSTCLKNIDNLYRSISNVIDFKYFGSAHAMNRLTEPQLPHGYVSAGNQILPLVEEKACKIYYYRGNEEFVSLSHDMGGSCVKVISFKFLKEDGLLYVKHLSVCLTSEFKGHLAPKIEVTLR